MSVALTGIGLASDALVTDGIVERRREGNLVVLDAPGRPGFWFGHGFVLDAPPTRAVLDALIAKGREHFGGTGAEKFVVMWERALGTREPFGIWPSCADVDRSVVQVYDGSPPETDARVVDLHGESMWGAAAALAVAEYPEFAAFTQRKFEDIRAAVGMGRARSVAILDDGGELLCTVSMYRGEKIARFATPVTREDARGRGLFAACARTLVAWALSDAPRAVVILANPGSGPVALYERLGFRPVAFDEAAIVTL